MDPRQHVSSDSLDLATDAAVSAILAARERFRGWTEAIRPDTGPAGRFHWAIQHTRGAGVPSTGYALGGLRLMGLLDTAITSQDRREGIDWVMSRYVSDGQFPRPGAA